MKLIKQTKLYFKEGKEDKVYEVDLCELSGISENRYHVNFRYGRSGSSLREGNKTTDPVCLEEAEKIFASVVVSKTNKGYEASETRGAKITQSISDSIEELDIELLPGDTPSVIACNEIQQIVIKKLHLKIRGRALENSEIKRLIWQAGELRFLGAVVLLEDVLKNQKKILKRDDLLCYCLLWALGRCAKLSSYSLIANCRESTKVAMIERISLEAMLEISSVEQSNSLVQEVIEGLESEYQDCLQQKDYAALKELVSASISAKSNKTNKLLYDLYLIAKINLDVRRVLIELLPTVPLTPNRFKAIRYLYKAAEFRDDTEVFGLLSALIDRAKPFIRTSRDYYDGEVRLPDTWDYVDVGEEAQTENSRIAFTDRTRNYLRRRSWRTLQRLGNAKQLLYVDYAVDMLIAVTDEEGKQAYESTLYRWVPKGRSGSYSTITIRYTDYCNLIAFNHILYGSSIRYGHDQANGRWYRISGTTKPSDNDQAFYQLWQDRPDAYVRLLSRAKSHTVHLFAGKAFDQHIAYWPKVSNEEMLAFINQPYVETAGLGLRIARDRYNADTPDVELLISLLVAVLEDARIQARTWIADAPSLLQSSSDLLVAAMMSTYLDVTSWAREKIQPLSFSSEFKQSLVARLFAYLQGLSKESDKTKMSVAEVGWYLQNVFLEEIKTIDLNILTDLLDHKLLTLKVLACELILSHQTPVEKLPSDLLSQLIASKHPEIRAMGVRMYGQLPAEVLVQQLDLVCAYCLSDVADIRIACRPMVKRLIEYDREFGLKLMRLLSDALFRKEPVRDFHNDLIHLLSVDMDDLSAAIDKNTVWRLLMARSHAANRFGSHLLSKLGAQLLSVRQWSLLGKNQVHTVRQWAWDSYQKNKEMVKQNPIDALRLLESPWDDTREFAINYFRNEFTEDDWNAEIMIGVCDSVREDVQQFGRELLTQFFKEGQGNEILSKLSQHPAVNVQLFTTHYLTNYAVGDPGRIEELEPYFITVLSHVNKARVAKTRVVKFLHEQALASAESAKSVARIFGRQSVTMVLRDHSNYLLAMRDIQEKYSFIDLPIKKRALQKRESKVKGVNSAV